MLWYIGKAELGTKRDRTHVICDCAETALKYVPKGEDRPRKAIEAAREYVDNPTEENLKKLNAAWDAASAAAGDAAGAAAGAAANAAGYAASAAAWDAAGDAAWDAAWAVAQKNMADIIRKNFKW